MNRPDALHVLRRGAMCRPRIALAAVAVAVAAALTPPGAGAADDKAGADTAKVQATKRDTPAPKVLPRGEPGMSPDASNSPIVVIEGKDQKRGRIPIPPRIEESAAQAARPVGAIPQQPSKEQGLIGDPPPKKATR